MQTIVIRVGDNTKRVSKSDYIKAKTEQLKEFGYSSLTEEDVSKQLQAVLSKGKLNVIGTFIAEDIVNPGEADG